MRRLAVLGAVLLGATLLVACGGDGEPVGDAADRPLATPLDDSVPKEESPPPAKPGECDACGGKLYQRPDDRPEAVRRRLEVYEEQTAPLVRYYERQGKLRRVNGQQGIDQVATDLRKVLDE